MKLRLDGNYVSANAQNQFQNFELKMKAIHSIMLIVILLTLLQQSQHSNRCEGHSGNRGPDGGANPRFYKGPMVVQ